MDCTLIGADRGEKVNDYEGGITLWGIKIISRYQKIEELKEMILAIEEMLPFTRTFISSIFCDSKACRVYSVKFNTTLTFVEAAYLTKDINDSILKAVKRHNGIYFEDIMASEKFKEFCMDRNPEGLDSLLEE